MLVGGEHPLAEGLPGPRDQGARAGGDHDARGANALSGDVQQGGLDEPGVILEEEVRRHIVGGVAQHPVDEGVPQILDVLHRLGDVQRHLLMSVDAVLPQVGSAVVVLRDLDHGLGRHAADAGAGGAGLAAVDEHKGLLGPADLTHGVETGSAGPDDGDVDVSLFHWEPRLDIVDWRAF